jgi:hypothetical protein
MYRVALINVYMGKLPNYFQLWLESAKANEYVDFYLFTDALETIELDNVHIINMSFVEVKELIKKTVGIQNTEYSPYKICDFKPCYSTIFGEYIKEKYDWCGNCDLDVIFGDISRFCCEVEILNNYEQVLGRGHLTIYKYPDTIDWYKMTSDRYNWKEVLESPYNYAFDEWNGVVRTAFETHKKQYLKEVCADISFAKYRLTLGNGENYKYQAFMYDHGRIYQLYLENGIIKHKEYAYIHLQKRTLNFDDSKIKDKFYILPNKFLPWYPIRTKIDFLKLNPPSNLVFSVQYMLKRIKWKRERMRKKKKIISEKLKKLLI